MFKLSEVVLLNCMVLFQAGWIRLWLINKDWGVLKVKSDSINLTPITSSALADGIAPSNTNWRLSNKDLNPTIHLAGQPSVSFHVRLKKENLLRFCGWLFVNYELVDKLAADQIDYESSIECLNPRMSIEVDVSVCILFPTEKSRSFLRTRQICTDGGFKLPVRYHNTHHVILLVMC